MKDWRGNEFKVGDTVVYPRKDYGHSVTMVEGVVTKITDKAVTVRLTETRSIYSREFVVLRKLRNITVPK